MRIRAVALAGLCVVLGAAATLAPAAASVTNESSTGSWFDVEPRSQSFWEAAAKDARPIGRMQSENSSRGDLWSSSDAPAGAPVALAGQPPSATAYSVRGTIRRSDVFGIQRQSHVPYTRTEIADPTVYPYVTHGRLFMHYSNGTGFCSGTIVPDQEESLVITAGHCLIEEDRIVPEGISFAPGYRLGEAPFGYWNATSFGVIDQWDSSTANGNGDTRFDIGAIKIAPDAQGVTLGDAFGWRGIQFNQHWQQTFASFGYPGDPPFDGERLYSCRSTSQDYDNTMFSSGPYPIAMGCDMTPGSSGGGWVMGEGFVNSVVSYSRLDHSETQFGPYFGSAAQAFYENVSGIDLPDAPAEPVTHQVTISLSLRRHLIAKGALGPPDGYLACTRGAPVAIFKKKATGGWRFIKGTTSNDYGRYRMRLPDKPGRYVVHSPEGPVDDLNRCAETSSIVRRHSH